MLISLYLQLKIFLNTFAKVIISCEIYLYPLFCLNYTIVTYSITNLSVVVTITEN